MKTTLSILCLSFIAGAALSQPSDARDSLGPYYFTTLYNETGWKGSNLTVNNPIPVLIDYRFDNKAQSFHQMGMWIYYENENFNAEEEGHVIYIHGTDIEDNFPYYFRQRLSSLRYAGTWGIPNNPTWTLYDGTTFTGEQLSGTMDRGDLDRMDLKASSIITNGQNAWTLYSDKNFNGDSICVHPHTHDKGIPYNMDLGIYSSMDKIGIPDNSVRSVKQGCHSNNVAPPPELKHEYRTENGGWGFANP